VAWDHRWRRGYLKAVIDESTLCIVFNVKYKKSLKRCVSLFLLISVMSSGITIRADCEVYCTHSFDHNEMIECLHNPSKYLTILSNLQEPSNFRPYLERNI
jgi:hypothetical protein